MHWEATDYGPVFAALLADERMMELGPGRRNDSALPLLDALSLERAFEPSTLANQELARGCLAAMWLHHDFLDESHRISQSIHTGEGSYWHGIMHRREPDPSNAKYWFRKVGAHPLFKSLLEEAHGLSATAGSTDPAAAVRRWRAWDPFDWIDLAERARTGQGDGEMFCRQVQQLEWRLLFDYCYATAIASTGRRSG